jgi:hypothetical protein
MIFYAQIIWIKKNSRAYLHSRMTTRGALSSVGSEHLPYKQGVAGSNPAGPTIKRVSNNSF